MHAKFNSVVDLELRDGESLTYVEQAGLLTRLWSASPFWCELHIDFFKIRYVVWIKRAEPSLVASKQESKGAFLATKGKDSHLSVNLIHNVDR